MNRRSGPSPAQALLRRQFRPLAVLLVLAGSGIACDVVPQEGDGEAVILVHGLGRTQGSMMVLGQRLRWAGYDVHIVDYPSLERSISDHVRLLEQEAASCCAGRTPVHFVGHSLGGIVIRRYLAERGTPGLGRVVLLAPPNQGSQLADWVRDLTLGEVTGGDMLGPTGSRLGPDSTDIPASLSPPDYELGIITGDRSLNPIGSILIPGPDDGFVGVDEARIEGVPTLVLPRSHTFIMNSRHTADAVIQFIRTGRFEE
ncbi:MAG: alpha/beta fold hydrolase [Gemmatimonadetes bacterium]|nr:alpha/beta fold hydrolase [Gemmatimonadota bacterium]